MNFLVLRLQAPMLSFGNLTVGKIGPTDFFPNKSMLIGLLGNALGYNRANFEKLEYLQKNIDYACRWDTVGHYLSDYQTSDLSQSYMHPYSNSKSSEQNTLLEKISTRMLNPRGGSTGETTDIRLREYWTSGCLTVVINDILASDINLSQSLRYPKRPLFIGRKTCIPSCQIFNNEIIEADTFYEAITAAPDNIFKEDNTKRRASWPQNDNKIINGLENNAILVKRYELKDWKNQIHTGYTYRYEGLIEVKKCI